MSSQRLIVTPDAKNPQRGTLQFDGRTFACVLGRAGVAANKHEGDGATPLGVFPIRRVVYRVDALPAPRTKWPLNAIARDDGWCDAPGDVHYNQPVKLPYPASAESMWRDDGLYDVVVILGHNDAPVVPFAGSAIFMHVAAESGDPTVGCVALAREDLLALVENLAPGAVIEIRECP